MHACSCNGTCVPARQCTPGTVCNMQRQSRNQAAFRHNQAPDDDLALQRLMSLTRAKSHDAFNAFAQQQMDAAAVADQNRRVSLTSVMLVLPAWPASMVHSFMPCCCCMGWCCRRLSHLLARTALHCAQATRCRSMQQFAESGCCCAFCTVLIRLVLASTCAASCSTTSCQACPRPMAPLIWLLLLST